MGKRFFHLLPTIKGNLIEVIMFIIVNLIDYFINYGFWGHKKHLA